MAYVHESRSRSSRTSSGIRAVHTVYPSIPASGGSPSPMMRLYTADADPLADLRRLFEYIAFTVMVRNGDGHLKNFGLLYEHPGNRQSTRLAPCTTW